ncbi:hypothetical protein [Actinomadura geliboluensis]|uniref:hypothetical protein n=1 Tax=Actinomadura geliboluensis TaxID=882440 RepID=UPI0036CD5431
MRLNDGMPVWHCSVSVWDPRRETRTAQPRLAEREAVRLLTGVGAPDREWWIWVPALVGHLRVPVTKDEYAQMPPGCVVADAGESGPRRPRTTK